MYLKMNENTAKYHFVKHQTVENFKAKLSLIIVFVLLGCCHIYVHPTYLNNSFWVLFSVYVNLN